MVAITEGGTVDEATAVAFRQAMGFDASPAALRRAQLTDPSQQTLVRDIGIPLSPEETREMVRRQRLDDAVMVAQGMFEETWPDRFAGVSIDHRKGGRIKVQMVNPDPSDNIKGLFPSDAVVDVVAVNYSLADLRGKSEAVSRRLNESGWVLAGVPVDMVSINLELNAVELIIDPAYAANLEPVLAAVDSDVRVALQPRRNFEPTANTDAAAAGGQLLGYWEGGSTYHPEAACSTAFPVIRNGSEGVLTAYHCLATPFGNWYYTTHDPGLQDVGSWKASAQSQPGGVESAVLGYRDMLPKIWYPTSSNWNTYKVVRYAWTDGIPTGVGFHMTAPKTNTRYYSWAGVDKFDATVLGYEHMQIGWVCSQSGDSGSPVYTVHSDGTVVAGGILSFGEASASCNPTSEQAVWGRASQAVAMLGANFLTG
jgi:hypothetical protein